MRNFKMKMQRIIIFIIKTQKATINPIVAKIILMVTLIGNVM